MDNIELNKAPYVKILFPEVVEGKENEKGVVKYSGKLAFPKDKSAFSGIKGITDGQVATLLAQTEKFKEKIMKAAKSEVAKGGKLKNLFKDGDAEADEKTEDFKDANPGKPLPAYLDQTRGFWITVCKTNYKPSIFGPKAADGVLSDAEAGNAIYAGAWVRCDFWGRAWDYEGKKGWSLGLGARVQKWMDDVNYGGANEEVEEVEDAMEIAVPSASSEDFID